MHVIQGFCEAPRRRLPVLEGPLHLEVVLRPPDVGPEVGERDGGDLVVLRAPLVAVVVRRLDDVAADHAGALHLEPGRGGDGSSCRGGGDRLVLREGVLPHEPRGRGGV